MLCSNHGMCSNWNVLVAAAETMNECKACKWRAAEPLAHHNLSIWNAWCYKTTLSAGGHKVKCWPSCPDVHCWWRETVDIWTARSTFHLVPSCKQCGFITTCISDGEVVMSIGVHAMVTFTLEGIRAKNMYVEICTERGTKTRTGAKAGEPLRAS